MTGDIINLRRARKRRTRAVEDAVAATNRAAFGLNRHGKTIVEAERVLTDRRLSGHRLDSSPTQDDD